MPAGLAALAGGCGGGSDGGSSGPTPTPGPTPIITGNTMTVPLADFPALANADGFVSVNVSGHGKLIVCHLDAGTSASSYICLSQICTHQGCSVNYVGGSNSFACPCHGSTYATDGSNTGGPAMLPLHSYATTFDGTNVVVDLSS